MLELCLAPAIRRRPDHAQLVRAPELSESIAHDSECLPRLPCFMFKVDGQLLVSLVPLAGITQYAFPKRPCKIHIPVTLGQPCQCRAGSTVSFGWQRGSNRLLIQFASALDLSAPLAHARYPVHFPPILPPTLFP